LRISATIITRNEEANLPRILPKLDFVDEIVVVDSGSVDRTLEIARDAGAQVFERDWTGYADQKNFAAQSAANDWILSLDADEVPTEQLVAEIEAFRRKDPGDAAGADFPRKARYLGRWIHHSGWYPDRKVRLYDRRRARWTGDYVHESVVVNGPVVHLEGDLLHYTCDSYEEHIATLNRYTTLAAREMRAQGRRPGLLKLWISPPWAFVRSYLLQRGFLDGVHGLLIAWTAAFYVFAKYAKARTDPDG